VVLLPDFGLRYIVAARLNTVSDAFYGEIFGDKQDVQYDGVALGVGSPDQIEFRRVREDRFGDE
jgi:hypothetical protein